MTDKLYNSVEQCVQRLAKNISKSNERLDAWIAIRDLTTHFSASDDLAYVLSQLDEWQLSVILAGLNWQKWHSIEDEWADHTAYSVHLKSAIMRQFK